LTEAVEAPAPDVVAALSHGEAVVLAACDEARTAAAHGHWPGTEAFLVAAKEATAKLILLAAAPRPDGARSVEGERVVRAANQLRDAKQARDEYGNGLSLDEGATSRVTKALFAFGVLKGFGQLMI